MKNSNAFNSNIAPSVNSKKTKQDTIN